MTYTSEQYQADCLRTKSPLYHPEFVSEPLFRDVLQQAINAGKRMRVEKKACFGGNRSLHFPSESMNAEAFAKIPPDVLHAVMGLINEMGEIAEMFYGVIFEGKEFDLTNFIEELGDKDWFTELACSAIGVSREEIWRRNIAKLRARFPDKFDPVKLDDEGRDKAAEMAALERRMPDKPKSLLWTVWLYHPVSGELVESVVVSAETADQAVSKYRQDNPTNTHRLEASLFTGVLETLPLTPMRNTDASPKD